MLTNETSIANNPRHAQTRGAGWRSDTAATPQHCAILRFPPANKLFWSDLARIAEGYPEVFGLRAEVPDQKLADVTNDSSVPVVRLDRCDVFSAGSLERPEPKARCETGRGGEGLDGYGPSALQRERDLVSVRDDDTRPDIEVLGAGCAAAVSDSIAEAWGEVVGRYTPGVRMPPPEHAIPPR